MKPIGFKYECKIHVFTYPHIYIYIYMKWYSKGFDGIWTRDDHTSFSANDTDIFTNWCQGYPQKGTLYPGVNDKCGICDGGIHVLYDIERRCWKNEFDGNWGLPLDSKYYHRYVCQHHVHAITTTQNIKFLPNYSNDNSQDNGTYYVINNNYNYNQDDINLQHWIIIVIFIEFIMIILCFICWLRERQRRKREISKLLIWAESHSVDANLNIVTKSDGEITVTPEPHSHLDSEDQIDKVY